MDGIYQKLTEQEIIQKLKLSVEKLEVLLKDIIADVQVEKRKDEQKVLVKYASSAYQSELMDERLHKRYLVNFGDLVKK